MKKQINPTTKAHLIRGAFYLLLLLAVCAIPFALAQRQFTKQSVIQPAAKPNAAANMYLPNAAPPSTGAVSAVVAPNVGQSQATQSDRGTSDLAVPFRQAQPVRPAGVGCTLNGTLGTAPPGGDTGNIATRIFRPGAPTVMCGIAPTWPGNTGTGPFIYNVHYVTNNGGSPLCTAVALHLLAPGTIPPTNIQCSAFMAPFAAGDITNPTRYLGDAGVSTNDPLFVPVFHLTIPV